MKTLQTLPLLILPLLSAAAPAMAREWTSAAGQRPETEFAEKKGAARSRITGAETPAGGIPELKKLPTLIQADREFVKTGPAADAKPAPGAAGQDSKSATGEGSIFKKMLDGKLVALEGKRISRYTMTEEPRFYAFYFSAHWCPPCRAFTPKLVKFYNAQEGRKKDFEIIFVSSDNSGNEMEEYIKGDSMPWPAIAYRNVARMREIKKYSDQGIPRLVLVDRDGRVISDSYEGGNYVGPEKVMNAIPAKTRPADTAAKPAETDSN